ncbi:MAG TPA: DUF3299 domain-containing protein [bacterium]|nr:DUF3299 domain-containing protein [bacterium]
MRTTFKKEKFYGPAILGLLLFGGVFFSAERFFGQGYRAYSTPTNTASSAAEGSGVANDNKMQSLSRIKDPIVNVKPKDLDGKPLVDFSRLASFNYDYPDEDGGMDAPKKSKRKKPGFPDSVLSLNGAKVAIPGFMIPMDQDGEGDECTYFILARNQMTCCYGVAPGLNEWVSVRMEKGKKAELEMDTPVVVVGTLEVGEVFSPDSGWSFYRMKGEKVIVAGKKKVWFQ